jgi:hypothetical protein
MAYTVSKVEMWTGAIHDRVGGLAAKLGALADAGANLDMVIARRQPHLPGRGVVFLGPVAGAKAHKAAKAAGLSKANDLVALRVEGPNKAGEGSRMAHLLAEAGINLRGLAAIATGNKVVVSLGFDSADDANKAARLLRSAGAKRK